jgi:alpha-L-fucosidase
MKKSMLMQVGTAVVLSALICGGIASAVDNQSTPDILAESKANLDERMAWWEEARFALFIHWGAYSVLGGEYKGETLEGKYAEQIQRICKISGEDYLKDAASQFRPEKFDAEAWVKLAKDAGMKYIVITAKHHDGYTIYHSKHSEFDIEDAAGFERDPLKELSDACRKHGLKLGVYYSQSQDWHDVFDSSGDWLAPGNPAMNRGSTWSDPAKVENAAANRKMFEKYIKEKGVPQIIELIEDYGVEMLWYDTPGAYIAEYARPFFDAAREANPDIIINARIGFGFGDYGGSSDSPAIFPDRAERYWEAIQSTLHSWGYNKFDEGRRRPTAYLLRMLATVVSKGGNMMINVGPKGDGTLVENDAKSLKEIASWSKHQIESIHGAGKSPLPAQNWGVVTRKENDLYLHVFDWPRDGKLRVGGLHTPVKSATLLIGKERLNTRFAADGILEIDLPAEPSHPVNSVIRLRCQAAPEVDEYRLIEQTSMNRLHTAETSCYEGGVKSPLGMAVRAFVRNFNKPESAVTWKVRVAERGTYNLQVLYDLPHGTPPGDAYEISIGGQKLVSVVDGKSDGDLSLITAEQDFMHMKESQKVSIDAMGQSNKGKKGPTQGMVIDQTGSLTLEPGVYDLTIKAAGEVRGNPQSKDLFNPRAVFLEPVRTSGMTIHESNPALEKRMAWWEESRFALFIHWGAYSVLGGEYKGRTLEHKYAEQIQRICKISGEDYLKDAASQFRPEKFDAEAWVKLAKDAGMKYVVITAKHHDGFAIYHSRHSDFDIGDTAGWERDPLKELSDACRKHGLKFGVYYSQSQDWHDVFDPSGEWTAPGNPASNPGSKWGDPAQCDKAEANREMFKNYMEQKGIPQVVELIEDYGVELVWYDTSGAYLPEYAQPFLDAVRQTDPHVVVNARIGCGLGDYQGGPDSPVVFSCTEDRYWEAIQSTLHSWGYNKFDEVSRRPTDYLLRMLATVVSKGGNMMINVGPKPDGTLVENDVKSLKGIAAWSRDNIESIHGAQRSPLPPQNWGVITRKGNDLFLHVFDWPADGQLRVGGLQTAVASATPMVGDVVLKTRTAGPGVLVVDLPSEPSHPVNSVIRLRCADAPEGDDYRLLEPGSQNRFHVTDTPFISGEGIRNPIGVGFRAFLENWTDPAAAVVWKIRVAERGTYDIQFLYDLAKGKPSGDAYQIQIGDQAFPGVVALEGTGDEALIEQEMALMRMTNPRRMVADRLGKVTLMPGVYDITLKSAGAIRGNEKSKELFLPRAVLLVPEENQ